MLKKSTVKEASASALDIEAGKTASVGPGISIPKSVWEKFVVEVQSRTNLKIHVEADGPQISKITIE